MESVSEVVVCGVCLKTINDPYRLPCGHTFCLRPCLLAHAKSVKARCIYCHLEFCASELRPDYSIGAKLHSKLFEKSQVENDVETLKSMSSQDGNCQTQCSACRERMKAEQLKYCQHCYRSVCSPCLVKHFDSFAFSVRVKLTALARQKLSLSSELQELKNQSRGRSVPSNLDAKGGITAELDEAVAQLNRVVSEALDNATSKLESLDVEGSRSLNEISKKLLENFRNLGDVQNTYTKLEDNQLSLQDLTKIFQHLKGIQGSAELPDELPILPITLMEVSRRIYKIIEEVADFNLLIFDDPTALSTNLSSQRASGDQVDVANMGISKVKLYVGGLRANHTEEHLKRHFESAYGPLVDCYVARNYKTNASRCYGFVTFKEAIHASRALKDFPHFIEGTPVQVRPYKVENDQKKKTLTNHSSSSSNHLNDKQTVLVSGVSGSSTEDSIKIAMSTLGPIQSVELDSKRGFAAVTFANPETAALAVSLEHFRFDDTICKIQAYSKGTKSLGNKGKSQTVGPSQQIHELRLFVKNIGPSVGERSLKEYFSRYGKVTRVNVILEHGTGKPRGMAFVDMGSKEGVKAALDKGPHIIDGKQIVVRAAYTKDSKCNSIAKNVPITADFQLIIHGIPNDVSRQDLLKCFSTFGGITALRVDEKSHVGFLNFFSAEALKAALESSPHHIKGSDLQVSLAKPNIKSNSEPTLNIQVGDISSSTSSQDLFAFFGKFGGVVKAKVVTGGYRRIGFVRMFSFEAVKKAVNAKAPTINGNYVTIRPAFSKEQASSHRSRVKLLKINKEASTTTAANESVNVNPLNPQKIVKPIDGQVQPKGRTTSQKPVNPSGPSTSTASSDQKLKTAKPKEFSLFDYYFGKDSMESESQPASSVLIDLDSDSDYCYTENSKDTDLGDGYWYDSD